MIETASRPADALEPVRPPADDYLALIRAYPLRPIFTEAECDRAIDVLNGLIDRSGSLSSDALDYQQVLGTLIHEWESANLDFPEPTGVEVIRDLMEYNDLTQGQFAERAGLTESTVSMILAGARGVSKGVARKIGAAFKMDYRAFL